MKHNIKAVRFGLPVGNLWLASATLGDGQIRHAVAATKEEAKRKAAVIPEPSPLDAVLPIVLAKYKTKHKNPMLVVGANNWIRQNVPFFVLQKFDLFPLFYPNAAGAWVCGVVAFSRVQSDAAPIWSYAANLNSETAVRDALWGLLPKLGHTADENGGALDRVSNPKILAWWQNWIYRSPKITLRDVLHLAPYPDDAGTAELNAVFLKENSECNLTPSPNSKGIFRLIQGGGEGSSSPRAGFLKGIDGGKASA